MQIEATIEAESKYVSFPVYAPACSATVKAFYEKETDSDAGFWTKNLGQNLISSNGTIVPYTRPTFDKVAVVSKELLQKPNTFVTITTVCNDSGNVNYDDGFRYILGDDAYVKASVGISILIKDRASGAVIGKFQRNNPTIRTSYPLIIQNYMSPMVNFVE